MGPKGPTGAAEGCSPPQDLEKAAHRLAIFLVNFIVGVWIGNTRNTQLNAFVDWIEWLGWVVGLDRCLVYFDIILEINICLNIFVVTKSWKKIPLFQFSWWNWTVKSFNVNISYVLEVDWINQERRKNKLFWETEKEQFILTLFNHLYMFKFWSS